jgi:hypothetical protein
MTFSAAPAPREITTPIILFGFRQPDRLARVCRALRAQRGVAIDERRIHLMMDGAVSPRTGRRYASGAEIAAVREVFPCAELLAAPTCRAASPPGRRVTPTPNARRPRPTSLRPTCC